jgi:hypothetical protein
MVANTPPLWYPPLLPQKEEDSMPIDTSLLRMALIGYEAERENIEQKIAEIQALLNGRPHRATTAVAPPRRRMSAAAKKRIAAAQKKRWAAYRKKRRGAA